VIHQDVKIFASVLTAGERVDHQVRPGRRAWLQVVRGAVVVNGRELRVGDGAATEKELALAIDGKAEHSELLLFDLP
jgi:redox-sensitive bicupin YhaK (pirin superfamily)